MKNRHSRNFSRDGGGTFNISEQHSSRSGGKIITAITELKMQQQNVQRLVATGQLGRSHQKEVYLNRLNQVNSQHREMVLNKSLKIEQESQCPLPVFADKNLTSQRVKSQMGTRSKYQRLIQKRQSGANRNDLFVFQSQMTEDQRSQLYNTQNFGQKRSTFSDLGSYGMNH